MEMKNKISVITVLITVITTLFVMEIYKLLLPSYYPENVYNNSIESVVEIKIMQNDTIIGYATGAVINDNYILTNRHVVASYNGATYTPYGKYFVRYSYESNFIETELINFSEEYDLALLKPVKQNKPYFQLKNNLQAKNGETTYTIGNNSGYGLSLLSGNISNNEATVTNNGETVTVIQTSLLINEGNSGGPLLNQYGQLIGLISFRILDNYGDPILGLSFAVPLKHIISYTTEVGI